MQNNKFYSITKGQLVMVWIFGLIGGIFCISMASEGGDNFLGLLGIGLLCFVFFYTFGWKANKEDGK